MRNEFTAIIERDGRKYIIVALVNDPNGSKWLEKIVVEMDKIIHGSDAAGRVALSAIGALAVQTKPVLH